MKKPLGWKQKEEANKKITVVLRHPQHPMDAYCYTGTAELLPDEKPFSKRVRDLVIAEAKERLAEKYKLPAEDFVTIIAWKGPLRTWFIPMEAK